MVQLMSQSNFAHKIRASEREESRTYPKMAPFTGSILAARCVNVLVIAANTFIISTTTDIESP
jgi:hypothetical protein